MNDVNGLNVDIELRKLTEKTRHGMNTEMATWYGSERCCNLEKSQMEMLCSSKRQGLIFRAVALMTHQASKGAEIKWISKYPKTSVRFAKNEK